MLNRATAPAFSSADSRVLRRGIRSDGRTAEFADEPELSASQSTSTFASQTHSFLNTYKREINLWTNYSASVVCGLSFILANTGAPELLRKTARYLGFGLTSLATASSGVVNAHSAIQGKNLLAAVGSGIEIPTAAAAIGKNLWLFRGVPLFGENQQLIFSNLEARDENDERTTGIKMDTLFKNLPGWEGYITGLKTMLCEMPYILLDFIKDTKKAFTSSPHVVFLSTTSQLIGAVCAFFGYEKVGAGFRNTGAVGVDAGCILDQLNKNKIANEDSLTPEPKGFFDKLKNASSYCWAGVIWGAAAFIDFFKRFDFISDRIKGLSELEYVFDRAATAFFNSGNDAAANAGLLSET